jgi:hypothetical protein
MNVATARKNKLQVCRSFLAPFYIQAPTILDEGRKTKVLLTCLSQTGTAPIQAAAFSGA